MGIRKHAAKMNKGRKRKASGSDVSPGMRALRGLTQGATLGFADEPDNAITRSSQRTPREAAALRNRNATKPSK